MPREPQVTRATRLFRSGESAGMKTSNPDEDK
jgi:hypothetical protein